MAVNNRVTVVTAFYNREYAVERTLGSLLRQTYNDMEVIILDDCSTDGTGVAIDAFIAREEAKNFRVIRPEHNIGLTAGLLKAIRAASGEYIAIHGSGDVAWPSRIEAQANFLDTRPDICLVGCYYRNIVEGLGKYRVRAPDAEGTTLERLLKRNLFSHGEVMFRRSAYFDAGEYRPVFRYSQDIDLWLRMIRQGGFATVKEVLYDRYVQMDGVTYNVKKFPIQTRYGLLARRLATMPQDQSDAMLSGLTEEKLLQVIPLEDAELQQRFANSILTMAVWGNPSGARAAARALIVSPPKRLALQVLAAALDGPIKPIMRFATERASAMRPMH